MPVNPNSLVDYLRQKRVASDFAARRGLWQQFDPSQVYTGTAVQNKRLLDSFRFADLAPRLELTKEVYARNEMVTARVVSEVRVGIESDLADMSLEADPNEVVDLGRASVYGFVPILVRHALVTTFGTLVLTPRGGNVHVGLWAEAAERPEALLPVEVGVDERDLLQIFYEQAYANDMAILKQAAETAAKDFLAPKNWLGLGLDVFIAIAVIVRTRSAGAKVYLPLLLANTANWGFDYYVGYLKEAIRLTTLTDAQKDQLRVRLVGGIAIQRTALALFQWSNRRTLCNIVDNLGDLPDWIIETADFQPDGEGPALAGKLIRTATTKSIILFCKITNTP